MMHSTGRDELSFLCNMGLSHRQRGSYDTTGITPQQWPERGVIMAPHSGATKKSPRGGPLSPTIFNMVVGTVIRHWVTLVEGEGVGPNGFRRAVQWLAEFFYANVVPLASPRPSRPQAALDVLEGLFDRVGFQTNVNKTVGMVCQNY